MLSVVSHLVGIDLTLHHCQMTKCLVGGPAEIQLFAITARRKELPFHNNFVCVQPLLLPFVSEL